MIDQSRDNRQLAENWLQQYKADSTFYAYRTAVERFISFLGVLQAAQLERSDVERFAVSLESDVSLSSNSVRSYKAAIRSFLKYAKNDSEQTDLLEPLSSAYLPHSRLSDIRVDCRLNELLNQEPNRQNRFILLLTIALDCLVSEVLNLTWADVDFDRHTLTLYRSSQQPNRARQSRTVSLCDPIWLELIALQQDRMLNQHVFHGVKGRIDSFQVNRIISRALKRIGIDATPSEVCFSLKKTPRKYQIIASLNISLK
jgi:integrase